MPIKKLLTYTGIDCAIVYTLIGRSWGLLSGVATLFLVVRFLTPGEQGYYYTFASLLAMQVFFELGMNVVVTQFASHEMARLSWADDGTIQGDQPTKSRLRSLLLLVIKWYGIIAVLIVAVILPIGWIFFVTAQPQSTVNWQASWLWLVVASAVNIFIVPLLSLLEGCDRVTSVARLRMYQGILGNACAWLALINGGGLIAMPIMSSCSVLTVLIWLWHSKKAFFIDLLNVKAKNVSIHWKTEIWPFQWKIALSWLSGYFVFQLFTPVLFMFRGAIEAGQMGMSFSLANALMSIPMAWMNTKAPKFGTLIAKKDYVNLDKIFSMALSRSFLVMVILGIVLCVANYLLHIENIQFASRLLEPLPFTLLILATTLNYVTYAQSAYLRAHKQEPFLLISVVSALLVAALTLALGKGYGALGIMSGYLVVCTTIGLCWGSKIFFSKRHEWQKNSLPEAI